MTQYWTPTTFGLTPHRTNDWDYRKWSEHAKYADAVGLDFDQPHYYWQAGVYKTERHLDKNRWSFISRDLPSFSATEENFIMFKPEDQKGIQCRFGERGVVASTHYDAGRNMVGLITGAKRYILSPPRECYKMGLWNSRVHPFYRHSYLNFGRVSHVREGTDQGMTQKERDWMEHSGSADAVETVVKEGEILYIPSFWFHYIVSLQKSSQCNSRSGIVAGGTYGQGGLPDILSCKEPKAAQVN